MAKEKEFTIENLYELVGAERRADVEALIKSLTSKPDPLAGLKAEDFGPFLKSHPELGKIFDAEVGARVSKGVESGVNTWKEKNFDVLYQERYNREHPPESDAEKRIRVLESQVAESVKAAEKSKIRSEAIAALTQAKIENPVELASMLLDEGQAMDKVKMLSGYLQTVIGNVQQSVTADLLKNNGRNLDQHTQDLDGKYYSVDQLNNMTAAEFDQNYDKVQESLRFHQSQQ